MRQVRLRRIQPEQCNVYPPRAHTGWLRPRFFAELDDDDLLLPGALTARCKALTEQPDFDVVVTNGFRRAKGEDMLHISDFSVVARDPLRALLKRNWLLPGCWLCQTDRVGVELFEGMPRFRECTYIAIQFATAYHVKFLCDPTVIYHADTPQSVSKSREYVIGELSAHLRLLELDLPSDVRFEMRKGLSGYYPIHCCNAYQGQDQKGFDVVGRRCRLSCL